MSKHRAYLSLGSNLGDRDGYLDRAIGLLSEASGIQVRQVSPRYQTEPIGPEEQDRFLNQVVEIETKLSPQELLNKARVIESDLGRKRKVRWGPRTIDIDLLLFDQVIIGTPDLTLPHPRMLERAFVMVPLADLAPDLMMEDGHTAREWADTLREEQEIHVWNPKG